MSIASENEKQIRKGMEVHVSLNTNVSGSYASVYSTSSAKIVRDPSTDQSDINAWPWRRIADFQGDGFPLDGSFKLWDGDTIDSQTKGVVGIRSNVGISSLRVVVHVTGDASELTLRFASEGGTIQTVSGADSVEYDIRETVIIPCSGSSELFYCYPSDQYSRVEIFSITPGVSISIDNDNLLSATLALRADLSLEKPSFPVSEIEVRAYWPSDISAILANIDEGVPLTYYAGYSGSYSTTRHFYLSEPITMEKNELLIKAEDSSARLDTYRVPLQALYIKPEEARRRIYTFFRNIIKNSGISLTSTQANPPLNLTGNSQHALIIREGTAREYVQDIMNLSRAKESVQDGIGGFWPSFVDAGIPKVTWSKPTAKWNIYEYDCGEVKRNVSQQVKALKTEDSFGVDSSTSMDNLWTPLYYDGSGYSDVENRHGILGDPLKVTAGQSVIKNFDLEEVGYWHQYLYTDQPVTRVWSRINSICFKPTKTSKKIGSGTSERWTNLLGIKGKRLDIRAGDNPLTKSGGDSGRTIETDPIVYGHASVKYSVTVQTWQGPQTYTYTDSIYPVYDALFRKSNITGSFLWKGDPRMQPRDVFNFHRLNGTIETCTIESIELKHEGGGTTATISYRLGVV